MAATDILSEQEAADAIRSTSAANITEIAALNSSVTGQIDALCGPVVIRSVTERVSGQYTGPILLRSTPVASITSVVEHVGSTNTTIASTGYELESTGHFARLFRLSSGYDTTWTAGSRNFTVTVASGRYTSTATVDPKWKGLAASILRAQWQQDSAVWQRRPEFSDDEGLPGFVDVEDMIRRRLPYELLPPGMA